MGGMSLLAFHNLIELVLLMFAIILAIVGLVNLGVERYTSMDLSVWCRLACKPLLYVKRAMGCKKK